MKRIASFLIVFCVVLSLKIIAWGESGGPRALGLNHALRGAVCLNEGLYINPASFGFTEKYSVETQISFQNNQRVYNTSIVDTRTSSWGAALGYSRVQPISEDVVSDHQFHIAAAKRLGLVSLGIGGRCFLNNERTEFNGSAGVLVEPHPAMHIGLVGDNLLSKETREVGVGAQFNVKDILLLSLDGVKKENKPGYDILAGAEIIHARSGLSLRGGGQYNTERTFQSFSVGGGLSLHKMGLHYGFKQDLNTELKDQIHSVALRIFF
ncbi:MAG TPA: hypothetical protein VJB34_06470 [Bdellovibrionota bacterium]|nr:hypothetical protein [Bdellovibrionota bacterium]